MGCVCVCVCVREREREREREGGREREREGGREGEREIGQLPLIHTRTRDPTCNLGLCPDWGLNPQPFGVWDDVLSN